MTQLWQDLRYGARTLRQQPGFTLIAVLTLSLGIGATTAIFSFVDAVLLKPLAYPEAERLVTLWDNSERCTNCLPSPPTFVEWKNLNTVFSQVAGYTDYTQSYNLTGHTQAEQLLGRQITANYFDLLGVPIALGRSFVTEEEQVGNEQVVILSQRLWQRRFGADAAIVGQTITLNEKPHLVVGVLPPHPIFDRMDNELWMPLTIPPDRMRRSTQYFSARAKLNPGVTMAQAQAAMNRLAAAVGEADAMMKGHWVIVEPLRHTLVATDLRGTLWLLLGAVSFILLIASVNVANLLLARGAARRKEVLIRLAVGASGWRLVRQLLTESLLLAGSGGVVGLFFAYWLMKAFEQFSPAGSIPPEAVIALDLRVMLFAAGVSLLTGFGFGLLPAWQATQTNLNGLLQEQSLRTASRSRSRSLLLIAEIALTFVLVVGAGLMLKSFSRLLQVDAGFAAEQVLTFRTTLAKTRFPGEAQTLAYQDEMLARLRALPGVQSVGVTGALPMSGVNSGTDFRILSRPNEGPGWGRGNARFRGVEGDYFEALSLRLVKGRLLNERDTLNAQLVVVVNQSLVNKFFPDSEPIGEQILFAGTQAYTIVGVVADVKHSGLAADAPIEVYVPLRQLQGSWFDTWGRRVAFVVRTDGDPDALRDVVRGLALGVDKDQPLFDIRTMGEVVSQSVAVPRFRGLLFSIFGLLSLFLAAVGIYGLTSYMVTQSTKEIGIRMALGAQTGEVMKLIIGRGLWLTLIGTGLGAAGAFGLTRLLRSLLFQVTMTDPLTFISVPVVLVAVTLVACWLPARRATKVDPMVALRCE